MKSLAIAGLVSAGVIAGCATTGGPEMVQCLQPNRRVVVQLSGMTPKPPAKPAAPKPGAKPAAKAAAKPAAPPKPPAPVFTEYSVNVHSNFSWDPKAAVLKPEGKQELDKVLAQVGKAKTTVQAVIVTGHSDEIEADKNDRNLSEARAKAVVDYLVSKGLSRNVMFWEGRGASQPVPVTKFCYS